jgi:SAM-dependent methyltransferase
MVPPRRLRGFIGSSDYRATGEFLSYFRNLCGLQPQHRVLDVGCGIGRMAVPLTEYLSSADSYEGIDIVPQGIAWCSVNITPKFPNFRFQLADVFSKYYNPVSRTLASEYRFPFPDDFRLIWSFSLRYLPTCWPRKS